MPGDTGLTRVASDRTIDGVRTFKRCGSQGARGRSSTDPSFEDGAQCARLCAREHRKIFEWLEVRGRNLPGGPSVWICGDCHLGNLGPLADAKGNVDVQIRDLDQTVIGNPARDLVRLGLSLASAARGSATGRYNSQNA
jgi:uncharacterized protein DUF2252